MTRPDLSRTSNPVMVAARHYAIPTVYAYLIADMVLAIVAPGRNVWPRNHEWHGWAIEGADVVRGPKTVDAFFGALTDFFTDRYLTSEEAA